MSGALKEALDVLRVDNICDKGVKAVGKEITRVRLTRLGTRTSSCKHRKAFPTGGQNPRRRFVEIRMLYNEHT